MAGVVRVCGCGCGEALPVDAHHRRKYLNARHKQRVMDRRYEARKRKNPKAPRRKDAKPEVNLSFDLSRVDEAGRSLARRGPEYEKFCATPYPQLIAMGKVTASEAAHDLGTSSANVSRWMAAWIEDKARGLAQAGWEQLPEAAEALEDFGAFCRRYWPEDEVTGFHMEWADLISDAIDTGGRVMLLAAQRHGKSTMLRKYCAWRIAQNPDIRILWVSQTQDLAEKSVGYVLDILTTHEMLAHDVLGPGVEFRPPTRHNMPWTSQQFTVGCRTKVQASPTMVALGKGGSILSRDADVVIVDDLQEYKHIRSPGQRESDVEWFFSDLMSRKLPHTGLAVIGSRQHMQDIYSEIAKRGEQWTVRVYPVHDPACTEDPDDPTAHDGVPVDAMPDDNPSDTCMLWPKQYPYWYMQEQRAQQGEAYFQRNMMNNPKDDATILVSIKDLERCKDFDRRVGEFDSSWRLIAGIDPAPAKQNAAVLFAWDGDVRHVVDIMESEPGVRGGRKIVETWSGVYGCNLFVCEENIAQSWWQDTDMRSTLSVSGARLEPFWTHRVNKNDVSHGVVAMFQHMRRAEPTIRFPYGDRESAKKMDRLLKTLLIFDPDFVGNKHADDDLPMAMWFPQKQMDGWASAWVERAVVDYPQTGWGGWRTAYPQHSNRRLRAVKENVGA